MKFIVAFLLRAPSVWCCIKVHFYCERNYQKLSIDDSIYTSENFGKSLVSFRAEVDLYIYSYMQHHTSGACRRVHIIKSYDKHHFLQWERITIVFLQTLHWVMCLVWIQVVHPNIGQYWKLIGVPVLSNSGGKFFLHNMHHAYLHNAGDSHTNWLW